MRGNPHLKNMDNLDVEVDILLASYNGEKFIKEQIQSILEQSHSNFNLIISDDNSVDGTVEIIKNIQKFDSRIKLIKNNGVKGVVGNFNNALRYSTATYIMFADQDDYWLENKVGKMLSLIMSNEGDKPALAFSDLEVVDENLVKIHESYYSENKLNPMNNTNNRYLLWKSTCYGCSVIINKRLLSVAGLVPEYASMHDHWYAYNASISGGVFYLPESTIKYRQHDNNVVGSHDTGIKSKILRINKTLKSIKRNVICTSKTVKKINNLNELSLKGKVIFVKNNIFPFIKERSAYCVFFIIFWIIYA